MKKFFYLMALICTLGAFTACSSDDDDKTPTNDALVGTWNVEESTEDEGLYDGSVKLNWQVPEGTSLSIDLTGSGEATEMDLNEQLFPLMGSLGNYYLPQVLKSVEFTKDGKINAVYAKLSDDGSDPEWITATGYATYTVKSENLIYVTVDADKATENIQDAEEKAQIKAALQQYGTVPVNIRWDTAKTKPYFYVNKEYVDSVITSLIAMLDQVSTDDMDDEDLASFYMIKGLASQFTTLKQKITKFEAGIELTK